MIRLFHVPLSPFCRKVRLSLAEKKLDVELVEESVKGSPYSVGGAYYLAFCQVWAPPFELDELDLLEDSP